MLFRIISAFCAGLLSSVLVATLIVIGQLTFAMPAAPIGEQAAANTQAPQAPLYSTDHSSSYTYPSLDLPLETTRDLNGLAATLGTMGVVLASGLSVFTKNLIEQLLRSIRQIFEVRRGILQQPRNQFE